MRGSNARPPLVKRQALRLRRDLGITSVYLQGIDSDEIIDTVTRDARRWCP